MEILEAKKQEIDHRMLQIRLENEFLMEGNVTIKEQVTMIQDALEVGK